MYIGEQGEGKEFRNVKEKINILGDTGNEVLYLRMEYDKKFKLRKFSLNLTTKIKAFEVEIQKEIVRYDCAHGFLHMHRFYRKPPTKEKIRAEISKDTAKQFLEEIMANYKTWVKTFMENYEGELK